MKCSEANKRISAFLDGEMHEGDRKLLSEHLKTCDSCRKEFEELSAISDSLRLLGKVSAPPFFAAQLKRRVVEDRKGHYLPVPFARRLRRAAMSAAAVAVFCVSLLLGGSLGKGIYELRVEMVEREELEIVDFLGVDSFNSQAGTSLVSAYSYVLSAEGE